MSGGLIAWQSYETRRTARAANEGTDIARRSLQVSSDVALEAFKARLDARAPRLNVSAAPTANERARHNPGGRTDTLGEAWPLEREFRRTEDDYQYLAMGAQYEVLNEGDSTVEISVGGDIFWLRPDISAVDQLPGNWSVSLGPGKKCEFRLEKSALLAEWADRWGQRIEGHSNEPCMFGYVTCSDSFDDGVIDNWELATWCFPVAPKPNDLAGWRLRRGPFAPLDPPLAKAAVGRQKRTYYFSKSDNRKVDRDVMTDTSGLKQSR